MQTKHTPGPWIKAESHVYYLNPRIEAGEDINDPRHDSVICECDPRNPYASGIPDEERTANAALIAAAPCLLEMVRELSSAIENRDTGLMEYSFHRAKALISKATA